MDTFDKVYVMMFGISNIVAGGPIYNANKIRFLESKGWNVVVFPVDSGKVYIKRWRNIIIIHMILYIFHHTFLEREKRKNL